MHISYIIQFYSHFFYSLLAIFTLFALIFYFVCRLHLLDADLLLLSLIITIVTRFLISSISNFSHTLFIIMTLTLDLSSDMVYNFYQTIFNTNLFYKVYKFSSFCQRHISTIFNH